jgi:septation ring formation regulator EzrA
MTDYVTQKGLDRSLDKLVLKLFNHFDKRFDEIDKNISKIDEKYDHLVVTLDSFLKRLDDIETDNTARDAQLARLERWIEQVANKTGVKLEY